MGVLFLTKKEEKIHTCKSLWKTVSREMKWWLLKLDLKCGKKSMLVSILKKEMLSFIIISSTRLIHATHTYNPIIISSSSWTCLLNTLLRLTDSSLPKVVFFAIPPQHFPPTTPYSILFVYIFLKKKNYVSLDKNKNAKINPPEKKK